jgi:hypothetical protein
VPAPRSPEPDAAPKKLTIRPFATLVGGLELETIQKLSTDTKQYQNRFVVAALSRFGLRGVWGRYFSFESELELNAGPHGTSMWEGQAALQARSQILRFAWRRLRVDLGRVIDDSSLDFTSQHVADRLLTDEFTRDPLLASGFNMGNGLLARYELLPGLRAGITLNAANPTSTTSSFVVGGTFPPFGRFYSVAWSDVANDPRKFPNDSFWMVVATPSVVYRHRLVEAQVAAQLFWIDTDMQSKQDDPIHGYNLRFGAVLHLLGERLHPFANFSVVQNEVLGGAGDAKKLTGEIYTGYTASGGLDFNYLRKHGVGIQYGFITGQQGSQSRTTDHYVNVGTTWWLTDQTSVGARFALHKQCVDAGTGCPGWTGKRNFFLTVRSVF